MTITEAFGRRVKENRKLLDMSQDDLAEASGLSKQTISKAENGRGDIELATAYAIACGLGVRIDQLFPSSEAYDKNEKSLDEKKLDFFRVIPELKMSLLIETRSAEEVSLLVEMCENVIAVWDKAKKR